MLTGALIVLGIALVSIVRTPLIYKSPNLPFALFPIDFLGHAVAGPLTLLCLVMIIIADGEQPIAAALYALSAAVFAHNLLQAHRGRLLLNSKISTSQIQALPNFLMASLLPFRMEGGGANRLKDIPYGNAGKRNLLDIYIPNTPPTEPMPVLIHIHGGTWMIGQKRQQGQPLIQYLASRGWMVADINYRLGPSHKMPAIYSDVLRAVSWIKKNAARYGGDPKFVAITGGSAGAHLAALAALKTDSTRFKSGFEEDDCSLDAAVLVSGLYDFVGATEYGSIPNPPTTEFVAKHIMPVGIEENPQLWEELSPIFQIHPDAPPILVIHGRTDVLAKVEGAEAFVNALKKVSRNRVESAFLPAGAHGFDFANAPPTPAHVRTVERFLNEARVAKQERTDNSVADH